MISIHVISQENHHLYERVLDDYFKQRYRVFIEEKGWKDISHIDGRERDAFDDEHAVYLVVLDDEKVIGGHRFYPTTRPYMLSEVFPYLSLWPLPHEPQTWECTRYFVAKEYRAGRADALLMIATHQFPLEEGISRLTGILEMSAVPRRMQAGLKIKPLGLPQDIDGEPTIAVLADVTQEAFVAMLRKLHARRLHLIRQGIEIGSVGGLNVLS